MKKETYLLCRDIAAALLAAAFLEILALLSASRLGLMGAITAPQNMLRLLSVPRMCIFWGAALFLVRLSADPRGFAAFLFRRRWQLGFAVILGATVLKLNGSSIGYIGQILEPQGNWQPLLGSIRSIRGDEFVAFTQMALAQSHSGFQWFSDIWGYSPSDMFIVYGQPVCSVVTLFRPFSAGYLLLGAERGLAFYWSSRLVFLFLVSFEFGRLFTGDKKELSAMYALLVSLSPVVQWWYSVNELVEMLIFGQAAILLTRAYLHTHRTAMKLLEMTGLVICAGGYVMTLYPAWMIPFFYVFLACFAAMAWEERKNIRLKLSDAAIWGGGLLLLALALGYIYLQSGDTIAAQMNTVYPGRRTYLGGPITCAKRLFRGWTSWLWTVFEIDNPCEEACFLSFFPMGILLSVLVQRKKHRPDCWFLLCAASCAFLTLYLCVPLPAFIGKLTLMNYTSPRIAEAVGFGNLIILFRALAQWETDKNRSLWGLVLGAAIAFLALFVIRQYSIPFGLKLLVVSVCIAATQMLLHFSAAGMRRGFAGMIVLLSIVGGLAVNPVNSGLGMIYDTALMQEIAQRSHEDSGSWFVSGSFVFENLPTLVGAKTVNALATYPDTALWEALGLETQSDIWNRYAHFRGRIDTKADVIELNPDLLELHITAEQLHDLGVRYILSQGFLEDENLSLLFERNGMAIYKIDFDRVIG